MVPPRGRGLLPSLRPPCPLDQVRGDLLDARVRSVRLGVAEAGEEVAGRGGEALRPPDGGAVEDEVVLRAGVTGGSVDAHIAAAFGRTGRQDFEAGDRRRQSMEL